MRTLRVLTWVALVAASGCKKAAPADAPKPKEWQLLASELPSALLSVSGRSASDVFVVGADKGSGPEVLHFDGHGWKELPTGQRGDLWWVQALPGGPVLMAGANATVLRYDGKGFERLSTPGVARQTVYGVWGKSGDDFYAVGNTAGRDGFVWHHHDGRFDVEPLPRELSGPAGAAGPGFFKVFGSGDDVWVVGTTGTLLHRRGAAPFAIVPTGTKETLFTVHGSGDRVVAVGGSGNGVVVDGSGAEFHDVSPAGAGLLQGIFSTPRVDWASGERGAVYKRVLAGAAGFAQVDHGLVLPAASSLHSVFVDDNGGVWSAGGDVLTTKLDDGMLIHYGEPVSTVILEEESPKGDGGAAR
ncbi:MAG TPA: hypothetical protein VGI39_43820 [Polyangiaceae bacterium]|jgi:hypothetical protein